jgi:hypothetical protein
MVSARWSSDTKQDVRHGAPMLMLTPFVIAVTDILQVERRMAPLQPAFSHGATS